MSSESDCENVVIIATPTASLLTHLLHALSHKNISMILITRPTSITFNLHSHNHSPTHNHNTTSQPPTLTHHQLPSFTPATLTPYLSPTTTLLTLFTGSDTSHLPTLVSLAASIPIKRFIPSEYALDTSNPAIRSTLPPYQSRFELQSTLQTTSLQWTALYAGCLLPEALTPSGVLGIDINWASVSAYSSREIGGERLIVLTTLPDLAHALSNLATLPTSTFASINGKPVYISSHITNLEEIVQCLEREGRVYDWYDFVPEAAGREAEERMRRGYFDGAVALKMRCVVWDEGVAAWKGWLGDGGWGNRLLGVGDRGLGESLEGEVRAVRSGGEGGCGC